MTTLSQQQPRLTYRAWAQAMYEMLDQPGSLITDCNSQHSTDHHPQPCHSIFINHPDPSNDIEGQPRVLISRDRAKEVQHGICKALIEEVKDGMIERMNSD